MKCWRCGKTVFINHPDFVRCKRCDAVNVVPNHEAARKFKQKLSDGYFNKQATKKEDV